MMSVLSGVDHDRWRDPRGRGAHEWWYFDVVDADQNLAATIIFFRGIPFSGKRQKHDDVEPDRFPAVAFSLYGPKRTELYFVNLHDELRIGGDRMSISVGSNRASYRDGAYEIEIDDELLDGRRVRASFSFRPTDDRVASRVVSDVANSDHTWILSAPSCAVDAQIVVPNESVVRLSGRGYHDHNEGLRSLQDNFRFWRWGRAHFSSHTLVFYEADGQSVFNQHLADERFSRNIYGLRYPSRTRIITPAGAYRIEQRRIVDNGPFYLRFLSSFTAPDGERVTGFSEVLRPAALNWRWFWPLLDSRVRPAQSRDRVGRKITQWLIQRGF